MSDEITNSDDIIDSRDVIKRIEELEGEINALYEDEKGDDEKFMPIVEWTEQENCGARDQVEELAALKGLQDDAEGYAPDWHHGAVLIREDHFEDYARELADDLHGRDRTQEWPYGYIDWAKAADALKMDYTSVDFGGVSYWVR